MVQNSMRIARASVPVLATMLEGDIPVVYGITAVRYEGGQLCQVMMGMLDPDSARWDVRPAPTRVVEVVDRLVEGDTVVPLFCTERGVLLAGPEVKVDVLAEGTETLALDFEAPGRRLSDLPRF